MADQIAGVGADGIARVNGGQDFTLVVQLLADGAVQQHGGRTFALSFRNKRRTIGIGEPVFVTVPDGADQFALTASAADTPAIVEALQSVAGVCEISEVFAASSRTLISFPTSPQISVDLSSIEPGEQAAPGTMIRYDVIAGLIQISQLGPMGWSAAQQVARTPGSGLADTSDAAFTAWLILKATGVNLLDLFEAAPAVDPTLLDGSERLVLYRGGGLHVGSLDDIARYILNRGGVDLASVYGPGTAVGAGIL